MGVGREGDMNMEGNRVRRCSLGERRVAGERKERGERSRRCCCLLISLLDFLPSASNRGSNRGPRLLLSSAHIYLMHRKTFRSAAAWIEGRT